MPSEEPLVEARVTATESVLVAGAAGFLGSHLTKALVARGSTVHALVRVDTNLERLDDVMERVVVHRVDVFDSRALSECLGEIRPRVVINAIKARPNRADPLELTRSNVLAPANLLVSAAASGCARFLQLDSSTMYEARRGRIDECTPIRPVSAHGTTKAAASLICRSLAAELNVGYIALCPFQLFGPWDERRHLVPTAIDAIFDDRELVLSPQGRRDWIFVTDVVEACLLALDADLDGEELNLGTGRHHSNEDVVETIARLTGRPIRVRVDERAARPWDRDDWRADCSKARRLLGWEPRHDLAGGLEATIVWECERRSRLLAEASSKGER